MKKFCSLALVALMAGALLCSCQKKSPEEQFAADMKEYYNLTEDMLEKEFAAMEKQEDMIDEYDRDMLGKAYSCYTNDEKWDKDDFEDTDLEMTPDQIKELNEIRKEYYKRHKEILDKAEKINKKLYDYDD